MTTTQDAAQHLARRDALAVLRDCARSSSAFLALNEGNRYFTVPGRTGFVAYRPIGRRYWIQFTGAVTPEHDRSAVDGAFAEAAKRAGKRVVAVQLERSDAERAAANGWVVNQFGSSYSIDLSAFSLRGRKFVKTRNMITRSRREGVTVREATPEQLTDPAFTTQLDRLDAAWLRSKGRHVKGLRLMVGERGGEVQDQRRLFVAEAAGRIVAYISYSPVFGEKAGWLYDLTRRSPDAPPGVVEHTFAEAAQVLREDNAPWLHLGLTPFVGIDPDAALPGASRMLTTATGLIAKHGSAVYPAASQLAFKLKWRPTLVTPEYIACPGRVRLRDLWSLARATNSL
ncbi:bifunctional lysylphosphatidylglycerol flippase/synthetase MprF [Rhodococcus rhodochrous]|uniref:bifunctional lysylphosphatidylglycerol flippase/synthetase MprF n=1 Tax=Rhodococcus rhodochrous TaxID=1829 RepID=UPI0009BE6D51|nr:DUF2156 domain-containing protein [Rhodococcus rhodochrous]